MRQGHAGGNAGKHLVECFLHIPPEATRREPLPPETLEGEVAVEQLFGCDPILRSKQTKSELEYNAHSQ